MKNRHDIANALMSGMIDGDGENVTISTSDAEWLLNYLQAPGYTANPVQQKENYELFYCAHCGKSFWFPGIEDAEIRKGFGYSVWYATCPTCREEVRLTDHYWR